MREVIQILTPNNYNAGNVSRIKYIVIHYTGAAGSAKANCQYFIEYRGSSAHYFVDHSGDIYQSIEDKNIAWHCGAKVYKHTECRNTNSIGIELCCRQDKNGQWYFEEATVDSAAELTRSLMAKYKVPMDHVLRHYDVTGKDCPNPFVKYPEQWHRFRTMIGTIPDGWQKVGANWQYYENGKAITGWMKIDHYWNYFDDAGNLQTGWQKIDGEWYYFEEEGDYEGVMWASDSIGRQHRCYVN